MASIQVVREDIDTARLLGVPPVGSERKILILLVKESVYRIRLSPSVYHIRLSPSVYHIRLSPMESEKSNYE